MVSLRCHFAVVLDRQAEAVCGPVIAGRADRLYLLRSGANDRGEGARDVVRDRLRREADEHRNNATEVVELDADMRHPAAIAHIVGSVVRGEPDNEYAFNITTGPREAALGGVLACTFWDVTPYVVHFDPQQRVLDPLEGEYRFVRAVNLPRFAQDPPAPESLDLLEWLADAGRPVPQAKLIQRLLEVGHVAPKRGRPLKPQAKQAQFRSIVSRLERHNLVAQPRGPGAPSWMPTDEGRIALALFRGRPLP